jgi:hypothetical protein
VTDRIGLDDLPAAFERLLAADGPIKVLVGA